MESPWILIDNYDSFSHMLAYYLRQIHQHIKIFRNNEVCLDILIALKPQRIIISPGPHTPELAGVTLEVIAHFYGKVPILGICLGHQALGVFAGMKLDKALKPIHGKTAILHILDNEHALFTNMNFPLQVMRYHSLIVAQHRDNNAFEVLAVSEDDNAVMIIAEEATRCMGFQFHPESVLTPQGMQLLINWNEWCF